MMRYVFIFLLVETYGRTLGLPLGQQTGNGTLMIGDLLSELAKGCKNEFVAGLINSKLTECNLEMTPIRENQIRCLMFYDANVVLCNLTQNSPELATDFGIKTKVKQDVSAFCAEAAQMSLPPTRFRTNITEVLHKTVPCTVVCTAEDMLSGDTRFYCKYYKWMLGIVHSQVGTSVNTVSGTQVANDEQKKNDTVAVDAESASDVLAKKDEIKETSSDTNNKITSTNTIDGNLKPVETAAAEPSLAPLPDLKKGLNISDTALDTKNSFENIDEPQDNSGRKGANSEVQIEHVLQDNAVGHGIESPKSNNGLDGEDEDQALDDNEEQGDSDGVGDGLIDGDGDKLDEGDKKSNKHEETPLNINSESSHADTYLNPMEGYTDDDDHFFPFFLTAVIVVVVLYVLYHNKNKVGKMFFGLIVEGRQTGRRRNSRGHAYRRLDTLEQAMSTNTAAPPSKIIY